MYLCTLHLKGYWVFPLLVFHSENGYEQIKDNIVTYVKWNKLILLKKQGQVLTSTVLDGF